MHGCGGRIASRIGNGARATTVPVARKLTSRIKIKGHDVAASPENPEYLVKSEKTGAEAAYKPGALRKKDKWSR